jgi:hypothetical protein
MGHSSAPKGQLYGIGLTGWQAVRLHRHLSFHDRK